MPRAGQTKAAEADLVETPRVGQPRKLRDLSPLSPKIAVPGLSKEQLEARSHGLGGSDAELIMTGNWYELWRHKTGRLPAEDLSRELAVQMGNWTEAFNAYWYELITGRPINRSPALIQRTQFHAVYPWMLCNIDGTTSVDNRLRLFEAKHTNPFGSTSDAPAKWYPQLQHCMEVMDLEGAELSVFFGNMKWESFPVERDPEYAEILIEREKQFWDHVINQMPPDDQLVVAPPIATDGMRQLNMRLNNAWTNAEADWLKFKPAVASFEASEKTLKELVLPDVNFAFGSDLCAVKDRAGKITIRLPTKKDSLRIEEIVGLELARAQLEDALLTQQPAETFEL